MAKKSERKKKKSKHAEYSLKISVPFVIKQDGRIEACGSARLTTKKGTAIVRVRPGGFIRVPKRLEPEKYEMSGPIMNLNDFAKLVAREMK